MNTKILPRGLVVKDLVADLSDAVRHIQLSRQQSHSTNGSEFIGASNTLARMFIQRIFGSICSETEIASTEVRECQYGAQLYQVEGDSDDKYWRRGCS